jgi:HEAT repeat protein
VSGVGLSLALVLVLTEGCRCGSSEDSGELLTIGRLELEQRVFDGEGQPMDLSNELGELVRSALDSSPRLRYREAPERSPDVPRLRVRARVSPDGATGDLHVDVTARIDRIDGAELSWEVNLVEPRSGEPPTRADSIAVLSRAVNLAIEALNRQLEVSRLDSDELLGRLDDPEPAIRVVAAGRLGALHNRGAVDRLCGLLGDEQERAVVEAIIGALTEIGDQRAVPCLITTAGVEEWRMVLVIEALGELGGSEALAFLEGISSDHSSSHIKRLAADGSSRIRGDHLGKLAQEGEHDHEHDKAPDGLIKALRHSDSQVRIGAARMAAETRRVDAIEPICDLLNENETESVEAALSSFAEIGDQGAIPCLVRWAGENEVRLALVIEVLARIGGPSSRSVLGLLARDHASSAIRRSASEALLRIENQAPSDRPSVPSSR